MKNIKRKTQMKKVLTATTAFMTLFATAAFADGFTTDGDIAYSIETDAFAIEVGPTLSMGNVAIEARLNSTMQTSGFEFDFTGASLKGIVALSSNLDAYSKLNMDNNLEYDDLQVGVAFSF
tara:strand:+ start:449 stop:811 length:363 start_codon:yes stop_codon:yes gene_type:complete